MNELISKLSKVASDLPTFQADKRNLQQKYDYISADQVLAVVGKSLANHGVMVVPAVSEETITETPWKSGSRYDSMVALEMTITDGDNSMVQQWIGRGSDYSVPDKATYKAITSGHKYFLMKLFNVGQGNDDGEHETEPPEPVQKPRQPVAKPAPTNGNAGPQSDLEKASKNDGKPEHPTIPMLKDLHVLGNEVKGDKWESVVTDYHAKFETKPDADGKLSTKNWTWEQYWEVYHALEGKKESA